MISEPAAKARQGEVPPPLLNNVDLGGILSVKKFVSASTDR